MRASQKFRLLVLLLLCCASPAYANNPPQPDGFFSILLIFPVVILGRRLAGAVLPQKSRWHRVAVILTLTVCAFLCAAGTTFALPPLLLILAYGIWRGAQILSLGQGRKKLIIGAAVIAWVLFGVTDYVVSIIEYDPAGVLESIAVGRLLDLAGAETQFNTPAHSNGAHSPSFGTIAELNEAGLLKWRLNVRDIQSGYRYGEIVDKSRPQFLFYAVPAYPHNSAPRWFRFVPGGSLLWAMIGKDRSTETGVRSFAVDESGVIRVATHRNSQTLVTREEAQTWPILQ